MYRVPLSPPERVAIQALRHDQTRAPAERDRVELLLLSDTGWSPPRIARHLGACAKTGRLVVTGLATTGLAGSRRKRPGPPPDTARRMPVITAVRVLLAQERTWAAGQLAAVLAAQEIPRRARQTRTYLRALGDWRRTAHRLKPRQAPQRAARARQQGTKLEKKGPAPNSRAGTWLPAAAVPANR